MFNKKNCYKPMKKIVLGFAMLCALTLVSCGNGQKKTTTEEVQNVEVVEQVASETVEVTDTVNVNETEVATEVETEKVDESI